MAPLKGDEWKWCCPKCIPSGSNATRIKVRDRWTVEVLTPLWTRSDRREVGLV